MTISHLPALLLSCLVSMGLAACQSRQAEQVLDPAPADIQNAPSTTTPPPSVAAPPAASTPAAPRAPAAKPVAKPAPKPRRTVSKGGGGFALPARLRRGRMARFSTHRTPRPVPNLAVLDNSGRAVPLGAWRGKVLLVAFWTSWCGPCIKALPALNKLKARFGRNGFDVAAINIEKDALKKARKILPGKAPLLKPYGDPGGSLTKELKGTALPMFVLLDRQGRELGRHQGFAEWFSNDAVRLVRAAVKGGA